MKNSKFLSTLAEKKVKYGVKAALLRRIGAHILVQALLGAALGVLKECAQ